MILFFQCTEWFSSLMENLPLMKPAIHARIKHIFVNLLWSQPLQKQALDNGSMLHFHDYSSLLCDGICCSFTNSLVKPN